MYRVEHMKDHDWPRVKAIYLQGINTGIATFQTKAPTKEEWFDSHDTVCRLVLKSNDETIGWAALSKVSIRPVYSGVGEVSIYIDPTYGGKGLGSMLLKALIVLSENENYWTLQAGIFPENKASLFLHKKCGFEVVGVRKKLGQTEEGIWKDVILLERRSKII